MKIKCHIGLKTLREKEKLLVSSNFAFSHNVFHNNISLVRQNAALCGNGLKAETKIYRTLSIILYAMHEPIPNNPKF